MLHVGFLVQIVLLLGLCQGRRLDFNSEEDFHITVGIDSDAYSGWLRICSRAAFCHPVPLPAKNTSLTLYLRNTQLKSSNFSLVFSDIKEHGSDRSSYFHIETASNHTLVSGFFFEFASDNVSPNDKPPISMYCNKGYKKLIVGITSQTSTKYVVKIYHGIDYGANFLETSFDTTIGAYNISFCMKEDDYTVETNLDPYIVTTSISFYLEDIGFPLRTFYSHGSSTLYLSTRTLCTQATVWKMSDEYISNWQSPSFSDALWNTLVSVPQARTLYYRGSFPIRSSYQFLAFSVAYVGGFAAYVNGSLVARFHIPAVLTPHTPGESLEYTRDYFTIPVLNFPSPLLFCIEIHLPADGVYPPAVIEGIPLVDPDSPLMHSINLKLPDGKRYHNPAVLLQQLGDPIVMAGSHKDIHLELTFTNQVNVNWDSASSVGLAWRPISTISIRGHGNSLLPFNISSLSSISTVNTTYILTYLPYKLSFRISQIHLFFKPVSSSICLYGTNNGIVEDGGYLMTSCPEGMYGYSLRQCVQNQLTSTYQESCFYSPPDAFTYNVTKLTFEVFLYNESPLPTHPSTITKFSIYPALMIPGLTLNETTGQITGTPTQVASTYMYLIGGSNPHYPISSSVRLVIEVVKWNCSTGKQTVGFNETIWEQESWSGCIIGKVKKGCHLKNNMKTISELERVCTVTVANLFVIGAFGAGVATVSFAIIRISKRKYKRYLLPIVYNF